MQSIRIVQTGECIFFFEFVIDLNSSPEWVTVSTSTGSEPRRRDISISMSGRALAESVRLKRYHGELVVLLLGSASDTIGHRISAPPDKRRRSDFFRVFGLAMWLLLRDMRLSPGTELRRWFWLKEDSSGRFCSTIEAKNMHKKNKNKMSELATNKVNCHMEWTVLTSLQRCERCVHWHRAASQKLIKCLECIGCGVVLCTLRR